MNLDDLIDAKNGSVEAEEVSKVVARLTTTYFQTKRGYAMRKDLTFLKRKCKGFNWVEEDANQAGAETIFDNIVELEKHPDGIYELRMCNESKDWETGLLDSWEYMLVPFEEQK